MDPKMVVSAIEKLLPTVGYRVEPVLKYLGEKGLPKNLGTFAETNASRLAVDGLRAQGVGRTDALLRVYLERSVDRGLLPETATPQPGVFNLVKPNLPAKLTTHIIGRPRMIYNTREASSAANPAYMMEHIFGAESSPALDAAEAAEKLVLNSHAYLKSLRPLVRKMKNPMHDKEFVHDVTEGYTRALPMMENVEKLWAEREALRKGGPRIQLVRQGEPPVPEKTVELDKAIADGQVEINSIYQPIMQKWAERSSSVRTMLAAEQMGNALAHPWLAIDRLHPNERAAATAIRGMLDGIGTRAGELGIPIIQKGYVPHFMGRVLENISKRRPDIAARSRALLQQLPTEMRWQQRSPASRMWWPAVQELQHYVPDAHRKLAFTPVLQKWGPTLKKLEEKGFGDVATYTRRYLDELSHGEQFGKFDKLAELFVGAEYLFKIGFMPSVAFKHLWKATRLFAMHPVSAAKTAPKLFSVVKDAAMRRFGAEPGAAYRLTSQMLQARALFHGFSGIDANRGVAGHMLGLISSMPTAAVEAGERGLAILATIHKGMARNLPFNTIQQQLYHTMLNVSFLGQVDRYAWLRTPLQRLLFLFYYTPMRITETTAKMALYSIMPKRYMDATREGFWTTLLKSPRRRDPFGTLYATHLARNIAVVGGAAGLAHAYTGISPIKMAEIAMAHLPFIRETTRGTEPSLPASLDIPTQISNLGGLSRESFTRALINHYSVYAPMKLMRMLEGDIPRLYKGGPLPPEFYYAISEPPEATLRSMQREFQQKNARRLQRQYEAMSRSDRYNVFVRFAQWLKDLAK